MTQGNYDVIIVGGGLGGLKTAELLESSGLDILLLERRPTIKKLVNHIYGVPWEYVKKWKCEKHVTKKCGFGFYTPGTRLYRALKKTPFAVVDADRWASKLKLTCTVKTKTSVMALERDNEGIRLTDQNGDQYHGRIVVDCTGDAQVISSLLGIKKSKCDFMDYACEVKGPKVGGIKEMLYYQDIMLTNCGGWYCPMTKNSGFLGMSEFTQFPYMSGLEMRKRFERYMKELYPFSKYLKGAKIINVIHKIGPTTTLHSSIAEDNYLAVGDAAGAGTPFMGLGFYIAYEMAESAVARIKEAFAANDVSKRTLRRHSQDFHDKFGKWYKWSYLLRFVYLRYVSSKELELLAQQLSTFNDKDYYAVLMSRITPRIVMKLFPPRLALLTLKGAFVYHILRPLRIMDLPRRPLTAD